MLTLTHCVNNFAPLAIVHDKGIDRQVPCLKDPRGRLIVRRAENVRSKATRSVAEDLVITAGACGSKRREKAESTHWNSSVKTIIRAAWLRPSPIGVLALDRSPDCTATRDRAHELPCFRDCAPVRFRH